MAAPKPAHKGVTPPISMAMPTAKELGMNDALVDELKRQNNFETPAETERRYSETRCLIRKTRLLT